MLSEWVDCGAPKCVARTNALAADRGHRTWRFKSLMQVSDFNYEAAYELDKRTQEMRIMLRRKVEARILHRNIKAMYRSMRRDDLTDHYGDDEA
jgi:hypothetical protein